MAFRILVDDVVVADSGTMTKDDPAKRLTADLTGGTWLTLVTDSLGSINSDHGDWANPLLVCN